MNNKKYLMIGLVILIMLGLGCVENKPSTSEKTPISNNIEQTVSTPTQTTTPIPTEDQKNIVIKYSAKKTDSITEYSKPKSGNVYLVVTMTIENHGYNEISTNPNYLSVISNNIKYDYSSDTFSLSDKLDTANVLDGGSIKGSIAFEVPSNIGDFKLQYKSFTDYNVIYNAE
jgi:hypothetical protein